MNLTAKTGFLNYWEEIVGEYQGITNDDDFIHLMISEVVFSFLKDTMEARYVKERLDARHIEQKIGVLRTDLRDKPIRIRLISSSILKPTSE